MAEAGGIEAGKANMMSATNAIRPSAAFLAKLPTLSSEHEGTASEDLLNACKACGFDSFRLELKLETPEHQYWVCTRGQANCRPGQFESLTVGRVTISFRNSSGEWECDGDSYDSNDLPRLRGIHYVTYLRRCLERAQDEPRSLDGDRRIAAIRSEIAEALKMIR